VLAAPTPAEYDFQMVVQTAVPRGTFSETPRGIQQCVRNGQN
jgi:hypothetical protein